MIEDLFTEGVIGAVERSVSADAGREDADWYLARLAARLFGVDEREHDRPGGDVRRLYRHYLNEISVDDLELIRPVVHEWFVEQLSREPELALQDGMVTTNLTVLYFLFPDTTLRHAVVGLLLQVDQGRNDQTSLTAQLYRDIIESWRAEDNVEQVNRQSFGWVHILFGWVHILLDYVDLFPDTVERALIASKPPDPVRELLGEHVREWSRRFGGDAGRLLERAVGSWDTERQE